MAKIFISYRRDDSQYQADKLHAALKPHVANPRTDIFIDVDNIPLGVDFATHLEGKVGECEVLLALIGDEWLNIRDPATGRRRLDDPKDFVRIEIAAALQRGIPVVPVLFDGASIPPAEDLPEDLKPLARRNGLPVTRASFDSDMLRLVNGLPIDLPGKRKAKAPPALHEKPEKSRSGLIFGGLAVLCIGLATVVVDPLEWFGEPTNIGAKESGFAGSDATEQQQTQVDVSKLRAGDVFRDPLSGGGHGPQMVVIPAGSFSMGPLRDVIEVQVDYKFAAGKYEVTSSEYKACVSDGICTSVEVEDGDGNYPVRHVSWNDAKSYAKWLSKKTGQTYRLLSESEWEYVARAGSTSVYPWGSDASREFANYGADECCAPSASGRDIWYDTSPVGSFEANRFGLHDMQGNVWEFVEDCFAPYDDTSPTDGSARVNCGSSSSSRVARGGSFSSSPNDLESAERGISDTVSRVDQVGFRVARTLS